MLDTDLAQQLGIAQPLNVRSQIIATNREELESFGGLFTRAVKNGQRGRPATAYYLNEEQALLVCMLSRTEAEMAGLGKLSCHTTVSGKRGPAPSRDVSTVGVKLTNSFSASRAIV